MMYLLTFAVGALAASLWWLLRWRRAALIWEDLAVEYRRSIKDADGLMKQQHQQVLRLLKELRASGHPRFQDPEFAEPAPARQNGRQKGAARR